MFFFNDSVIPEPYMQGFCVFTPHGLHEICFLLYIECEWRRWRWEKKTWSPLTFVKKLWRFVSCRCNPREVEVDKLAWVWGNEGKEIYLIQVWLGWGNIFIIRCRGGGGRRRCIWPNSQASTREANRATSMMEADWQGGILRGATVWIWCVGQHWQQPRCHSCGVSVGMYVCMLVVLAQTQSLTQLPHYRYLKKPRKSSHQLATLKT